jgi:hypothetical protein
MPGIDTKIMIVYDVKRRAVERKSLGQPLLKESPFFLGLLPFILPNHLICKFIAQACLTAAVQDLSRAKLGAAAEEISSTNAIQKCFHPIWPQ